ncbi:MAG: GNAT family protein [bacterium]
MLLPGKHINLRLVDISDATVIVKWRNSPKAKYLNKGASTVEDQIKWIQNISNNEYNYIIETKNNMPVGMISLYSINTQHKNAEVGRLILGDSELTIDLPVVYEALLLVMDFAFNELRLHRLYGTIFSDNLAMIKFNKYLGMREEGILRGHYLKNGEYQDIIVLGLLENEYKNTYRKKLITMLNLLNKK